MTISDAEVRFARYIPEEVKRGTLELNSIHPTGVCSSRTCAFKTSKLSCCWKIIPLYVDTAEFQNSNFFGQKWEKQSHVRFPMHSVPPKQRSL